MTATLDLPRIAEDLRALAWLHAAERDAPTWCALHAAGFPGGLVVPGADGPQARALSDALDILCREPAEALPHASDELAADYADIYLTHALRASPCESVWRDEDHLMMQAPTFAVRACYREQGLAVNDWRTMADDHLSLELGFIAHLLEQGRVAAARQFMAEHLLVWLPQFASRVGERARTLVYASLALLTGEVCAALHQALETHVPVVDTPA